MANVFVPSVISIPPLDALAAGLGKTKSNLALGELVPIPTVPLLSMRRRSEAREPAVLASPPV